MSALLTVKSLLKRRDFVKDVVATIFATLASSFSSRALAAKPGDEGHGAHGAAKNKRRWGMVIDLDRCTGCGSCVVACQQENNVPQLAETKEPAGAQIEWMSQLWQESESDGGLPEMLPFPCQHCLDAPCVRACPVGATFKDEEGLTVQVWERCIGCRYCMVACPYSRRSFNWEQPQFQGTLAQMLNPDVATRPMGVVEKCTFCQHRIEDVKERAAVEKREIKDEEVKHLTACSTACPGEAITFGDLHNPSSSVAEQARSSRVFRLLDDLGTQPSVLYLKRERKG
jgi:molybdopterin-containing oxidoreductase family iron-sulfur binding subunit